MSDKKNQKAHASVIVPWTLWSLLFTKSNHRQVQPLQFPVPLLERNRSRTSPTQFNQRPLNCLGSTHTRNQISCHIIPSRISRVLVCKFWVSQLSRISRVRKLRLITPQDCERGLGLALDPIKTRFRTTWRLITRWWQRMRYIFRICELVKGKQGEFLCWCDAATGNNCQTPVGEV